MKINSIIQISVLCCFLGLIVSGCSARTAQSTQQYFGATIPPRENVLRYVSGAEPESFDPQVSSGQPEARIYLALYEGLVEYHPKDMQPVPAIAERWDISPNADQFIFHLRKNAKWSDGKPITAKDFVYSIRRGFAPELLSRTANLGYYLKYAEAFNGHQVFVKNKDGFLLAEDFAEGQAESKNDTLSFGAETEFNNFIKSPERLLLSGDEKKRAKQIEASPKLKAAMEGAELVPVKAEDLGVEAIDDYTLRITLRQPAPFFLGLLAHQFFRLVPQHTIEKHGKEWTRPANIVTNGAFKVKEHQPYHVLTLEKNQQYWDAANVKLDRIDLYPVEEQATILNLYKAGEIDAFLNHTVPASWIDEVRQYKDEYLNFPEIAISYYSINVNKPPMDNLKVRQAFNLAVDKVALAKFRRVTQPLYDFTPEGIFPDYEKARQKVSEEQRQQKGAAPEEWANRKKFNPELARKLLTEAGFPVQQNGNSFSCSSFPADKIAITYNTAESNRQIAEIIQAGWKQNLGITVPLKNMEFKTFLPLRNQVQFEGFALGLWSGDYMDPFTFLGLHYSEQNEGATGWHDAKYDALLDEANKTADFQKRYELMARAEDYVMEQQIVIPLMTQATNWMKKPYVKGLYPNPGTLHAWKYVYIERDPAKWDANVENIMK